MLPTGREKGSGRLQKYTSGPRSRDQRQVNYHTRLNFLVATCTKPHVHGVAAAQPASSPGPTMCNHHNCVQHSSCGMHAVQDWVQSGLNTKMGQLNTQNTHPKAPHTQAAILLWVCTPACLTDTPDQRAAWSKRAWMHVCTDTQTSAARNPHTHRMLSTGWATPHYRNRTPDQSPRDATLSFGRTAACLHAPVTTPCQQISSADST